jgi:hypothetical protein
MARALTAGPAPRRRTFFGLLDADGWGWATLKALFWFVVIIFVLGYVPDRAYYFTVGRTLDLGILAWSPVNLCPDDPNQGMPCPAPVGAVTPWHPSPEQLNLPAPRLDAAFVQVGTRVLLIGGTEGDAATDSVLVAQTSGTGNFDQWQDGPPLPEPRADAGVAFLNGLIYVVGGYDADGAPADTTFVLAPNLETGDLGEWQTAEQVEQPLDLPEPRAAAPLVALADGLLLVGGVGADGQPVDTVWKSKLDANGALGEWTPQAPLPHATADAVGLLNGSHVWLIGGRTADGPSGGVQRATVGTGALQGSEGSGDPGGADAGGGEPGEGGAVGEGVSPDDPPGSPAPGVDPEVPADAGAITRWATNDAANLPAARVDAMGFAANGTLYVIGGSDGQGSQNEVYWAVPAAGPQGDDIPEWKHLGDSDLPDPGLERAAIGQVGPNLLVVGGTSDENAQVGSARTNLSPQEPFFRLGLVGMTVPGLKIEGEIGQQLGYLNAAGAGTAMFVLLIVIGWMFANRERTASLFRRLRARRR